MHIRRGPKIMPTSCVLKFTLLSLSFAIWIFNDERTQRMYLFVMCFMLHLNNKKSVRAAIITTAFLWLKKMRTKQRKTFVDDVNAFIPLCSPSTAEIIKLTSEVVNKLYLCAGQSAHTQTEASLIFHVRWKFHLRQVNFPNLHKKNYFSMSISEKFGECSRKIQMMHVNYTVFLS